MFYDKGDASLNNINEALTLLQLKCIYIFKLDKI